MDLARELADLLAPDRVLARRIDRIAYANDASVYRLVPRVIVQPVSIEEVRELVAQHPTGATHFAKTSQLSQLADQAAATTSLILIIIVVDVILVVIDFFVLVFVDAALLQSTENCQWLHHLYRYKIGKYQRIIPCQVDTPDTD